MNAEKATELVINVNGENITVYAIDNDANGNPRYVVHFLSLDVKLENYGKIAGLKKYRAKWFGGGYVFQAFGTEDIKYQLLYMQNVVKRFYKNAEN